MIGKTREPIFMQTTIDQVLECRQTFGRNYSASLEPFYQECQLFIGQLRACFQKSEWQVLDQQCTAALRTVHALKGVMLEFQFAEMAGWLQSIEDLFVEIVDRKKAFLEESTEELMAFVNGLEEVVNAVYSSTHIPKLQRLTAFAAYSLRAFIRHYALQSSGS